MVQRFFVFFHDLVATCYRCRCYCGFSLLWSFSTLSFLFCFRKYSLNGSCNWGSKQAGKVSSDSLPVCCFLLQFFKNNNNNTNNIKNYLRLPLFFIEVLCSSSVCCKGSFFLFKNKNKYYIHKFSMACCCRRCCRDSLSLFRSFSTIFFPCKYSSSWELQLMMEASTKKTSSSIYIICRFVSYFCFLSSVFSHWLSSSVCCKHSFLPFFPSSFCVAWFLFLFCFPFVCFNSLVLILIFNLTWSAAASFWLQENSFFSSLILSSFCSFSSLILCFDVGPDLAAGNFSCFPSAFSWHRVSLPWMHKTAAVQLASGCGLDLWTVWLDGNIFYLYLDVVLASKCVRREYYLSL